MTTEVASKRVSVCKKSTEGTTVTFTFANGEVRSYGFADFPKEIAQRLLLHGIAQKGGDAYAGEKDPADAVLAHDSVMKNLLDGTWTTRSEGSGPRISDLAEALRRGMEQQGESKTIEECAKVISGMEKDKKTALRKGLKPILDKIKLEKLQKSTKKGGEIDLSALMA